MSFVVNEANFQREVLDVSCPVLVHFWTPWCGLCRLISPMLEGMRGEHNQEIKLISINADENLRLTNAYRLKNVPTIILFENGELVERFDSFNSRDRLKLVLGRIMNNTLSVS